MYLFIFKYWGKKTFTWLCYEFRWMDWMLDWYPHQVILFVWLCDNFMNVWILQIREIPYHPIQLGVLFSIKPRSSGTLSPRVIRPRPALRCSTIAPWPGRTVFRSATMPRGVSPWWLKAKTVGCTQTPVTMETIPSMSSAVCPIRILTVKLKVVWFEWHINIGLQVQFSFISFGLWKYIWPRTSSQYVLIRATLGLDFKLHCIIISKKLLKRI